MDVGRISVGGMSTEVTVVSVGSGQPPKDGVCVFIATPEEREQHGTTRVTDLYRMEVTHVLSNARENNFPSKCPKNARPNYVVVSYKDGDAQACFFATTSEDVDSNEPRNGIDVFIELFVVVPSERRKGVGSETLRKFLDWLPTVLDTEFTYFCRAVVNCDKSPEGDEEKSIIDFYQRNGFAEVDSSDAHHPDFRFDEYTEFQMQTTNRCRLN